VALKDRARISVGGTKLSNGTWSDEGGSCYFAAFTSTATATILPIRIVPLGTGGSYEGDANPQPSSPIQRLQGAYVALVSGTAMAAQTTLDFGVVVYRNFGTLATQITNAGGALTSLSVTALTTSMPSGQTFTLTNAAGTVQTWTTSAAVLQGATSIPVNSQTPTGTNAVGNVISGIVGNGNTFGWLHAVGTPALAVNTSVLLPASVNTVMDTTSDSYGPFLLEYPGDIECLYVTSAGSISVSAGMITTLVA
jgi:hypothetical protein